MALLDRGSGSVDGLPSLSTADAVTSILRPGRLWSSSGSTTNVTYAFAATITSFPIGGWADKFVRADAGHITPTEQAFAVWSELANITFQRIGSGPLERAPIPTTLLFSSRRTRRRSGQRNRAQPIPETQTRRIMPVTSNWRHQATALSTTMCCMRSGMRLAWRTLQTCMKSKATADT